MGFVAFMGRLLVMPVALSGICLSMFFGIPMADAMATDQSVVMSQDMVGEHGMMMGHADDETEATELSCCPDVQMDHDAEAVVLSQEKTSGIFLVADTSRAEVVSRPYLKSTWIPPNLVSFHQQYSLIGIIFKRE